MLDFTEKDLSITSPPESSADTQTGSDNLPGTEPTHYVMHLEGPADPLSDPAVRAATIAKLAPYLPKEQFAVFTQDEEESIKV